MENLINWPMIREPYNWLTVALMLAIATFMLHLLLTGKPGDILATGSAGYGGL